jgi:hypothetical protein
LSLSKEAFSARCTGAAYRTDRQESYDHDDYLMGCGAQESQRGPIAKQRWAGLDQKLVARLTGLVNDLNGVGSFIELIQYFSSHN